MQDDSYLRADDESRQYQASIVPDYYDGAPASFMGKKGKSKRKVKLSREDTVEVAGKGDSGNEQHDGWINTYVMYRRAPEHMSRMDVEPKEFSLTTFKGLVVKFFNSQIIQWKNEAEEWITFTGKHADRGEGRRDGGAEGEGYGK